MEKINISGLDIYYYNNGCNVEDWLKQGHLYGAGNYKLLEALMIEDGIIIDAGAHIGTFSALPAIAGRAVIAIEAAPKNVECLVATFGDSIEIHEVVLADKKKRCDFSAVSGPFGWVVDNPEGAYEANTLDSIVSGRKVSGIKLDIEGGEIEAIDGATETLSQSKPPIVMEVNGHCLSQRGKRSEDLLKKIASMDYAIFVQIPDGVFRVDPDKLFPFCNVDVVCVHKDNLSKYSFSTVRSMEDYEIRHIAYEMCSQSNEDCKRYFKLIGIE